MEPMTFIDREIQSHVITRMQRRAGLKPFHVYTLDRARVLAGLEDAHCRDVALMTLRVERHGAFGTHATYYTIP